MGLNTQKDMEHIISKELFPPSGSYSHGVVMNGFLFTCGVGPLHPENGAIVGDDILKQTRQVFLNLALILAEKNVDFSKVVKITGYLQNLTEDFKGYDSICREFLVNPYPARTTVGATLPNILIEIDCIVAL